MINKTTKIFSSCYKWSYLYFLSYEGSRAVVRSVVWSMVRSVSQLSRSGWSVTSVPRLRVDRGSLVSHVGNESALEPGFILDHFDSVCISYCEIYHSKYFQDKTLPRGLLCRWRSEFCRLAAPPCTRQSPLRTRLGFLSWQSQPRSRSPATESLCLGPGWNSVWSLTWTPYS